jgi:hypothetical protein
MPDDIRPISLGKSFFYPVNFPFFREWTQQILTVKNILYALSI